MAEKTKAWSFGSIEEITTKWEPQVTAEYKQVNGDTEIETVEETRDSLTAVLNALCELNDGDKATTTKKRGRRSAAEMAEVETEKPDTPLSRAMKFADQVLNDGVVTLTIVSAESTTGVIARGHYVPFMAFKCDVGDSLKIELADGENGEKEVVTVVILEGRNAGAMIGPVDETKGSQDIEPTRERSAAQDAPVGPHGDEGQGDEDGPQA
jgi:hypothetical protein